MPATASKARELIFLFLIFASSGNGWAFTGIESASFLDIPIGGRPAAMGGAYGALADDVYAPLYNPSGLGFLASNQLATMHLDYLDTFAYEMASFVHPFSPGRSLGASVQYLHSGDSTSRDINGNVDGDFSSSYAAYSVGYGHAMSDIVSLGVTGKFIQQKISGESADAFAGNVGFMLKPGGNLRFSAVAANIGEEITFLNQSDPLPMSYRIGGALTFLSAWTLGLQGTFPKNGRNTAQAGLEWNPIGLLAIRGGYDTSTIKESPSMAGFTAGVGIFIAGQELDYAWVPLGDLGNTHYFSLVFNWGEARVGRRYEKV